MRCPAGSDRQARISAGRQPSSTPGWAAWNWPGRRRRGPLHESVLAENGSRDGASHCTGGGIRCHRPAHRVGVRRPIRTTTSSSFVDDHGRRVVEHPARRRRRFTPPQRQRRPRQRSLLNRQQHPYRQFPRPRPLRHRLPRSSCPNRTCRYRLRRCPMPRPRLSATELPPATPSRCRNTCRLTSASPASPSLLPAPATPLERPSPPVPRPPLNSPASPPTYSWPSKTAPSLRWPPARVARADTSPSASQPNRPGKLISAVAQAGVTPNRGIRPGKGYVIARSSVVVINPAEMRAPARNPPGPSRTPVRAGHGVGVSSVASASAAR